MKNNKKLKDLKISPLYLNSFVNTLEFNHTFGYEFNFRMIYLILKHDIKFI